MPENILPFKGCLAHALILLHKACYDVVLNSLYDNSFLSRNTLIHVGVEFPNLFLLEIGVLAGHLHDENQHEKGHWGAGYCYQG